MRVPTVAKIFVVLVVLSSGAALADEIVHFTNGTSMPIRSHKIEKDMIHVTLGADAAIAFPMSMVERIEDSGRNVFANPAYVPANQAIAGTSGPSTPSSDSSTIVTGQGNAPAYTRSARRARGLDPEEQLAWGRSGPAEGGMSPPVNSGPVGRRVQMKARSIGRLPGDPPGSVRRGDQLVLSPTGNAVDPNGGGVPQIVAFGPKGSPEPTPEGVDDSAVVPDAPEDSGADGSDGRAEAPADPPDPE